MHSCRHSGSEKQSDPELVEDLTKLQVRPGEKSWGRLRVEVVRININKNCNTGS